MHARKLARALAGAMLLVLFACSGASDGPAEVAGAFWSAAEARDAERLEALRLPGGDTSINIADSSSEVAEWSLGEPTRAEGRALIPTAMTVTTGEREQELEFPTVLVQHEGEWKVDLDTTFDGMVKSMLGMSMEEVAAEMAAAMGEAMGEAMQGMTEAMAQGMEDMARQMGDAMDGTAGN